MYSSLFTLTLLLTPTLASSWGDDLLANTARYRARAQSRLSLPRGWSLRSQCVRDGTTRLLSNRMNVNDVTIESCVQTCDSKGYRFAGVEYGRECWCSSSLNTEIFPVGEAVDLSECGEPCKGNGGETCGGDWAITIYQKGGGVPSATTTSSPAPSVGSRKYKLVEEHSGSNFFDGWTFFTGSDPTDGQVNYLSKSGARSKGLAYVDSNGLAVMKVDNHQALSPGAKRDSVRIGSNSHYSQGLLLFDIVRMPWGCSVWPALWTVGPNWPESGEIDIIEGANNSTMNLMTLHTGSSTSCSTHSVPASNVTLDFASRRCASSDKANGGCGYRDPSAQSYGSGFNAAGGGVFALLIDNNVGTKMWRFERGSVPADIGAGQPNPDRWGKPGAFFPTSNSCSTEQTIKDQEIIFDISLCGGWASSSYAPMGCGKRCNERIPDPSNFNEAIWNVKSVSVWQLA